MDLTENRFGMILPLIIRALKNSGGGTVTPEQIQAAVDQYLTENPVSGMTEEQEEQLNQNTQDIQGKVDKNQGTENAGKVLVVGGDGTVTPGETPIKVDSTLTQSGQAADAKVTGDELHKINNAINVVTPDKLYKDEKGMSVDEINQCILNDGKYITGSNSPGNKISLSQNFSYKVYKYTVKSNKIIRLKRFNAAAIQVCITSSDEIIIVQANKPTLDNWSNNIGKPEWCYVTGAYDEISEEFIEINTEKLINQYSDATYLYFSAESQDVAIAEIYDIYSYKLSDFKWLDFSVSEKDLNPDSVSTGKIKNLSVTYEKLNADVRTKLLPRKYASVVVPESIIIPSQKPVDIIYYNLLLNCNADKMNYVSISRGNKYEGFTRYNLQESDSDFSATIFVCLASTKEDIISKNTMIKIAKNKDGTFEKKVLFIGDSITAHGAYISEFKNIMQEYGITIELIGTLLTTGVEDIGAGEKCEGRGGWAAYNYCNDSEFSGNTNPFFNNGQFDFQFYMSNNGYDSVDFVFVNLGTNDPVRGDGTKGQMIECYNKIIDSIHSYDENIKIMLWLPPTRALAYNSIYAELSNALEINQALIDEFDSKNDENIYLVPVYLSVNPKMDYDFQEQSASEYNDEKVIVTSDPIHPKLSGHKKIASIISGYVKYYSG